MKKKGLTVAACLLIAVVLVTGMAFALSAGIRNVRAAVKLGDITVDSGTLTYLAALYKRDYIDGLRKSGVDASDSEEFWDSEKSEGVRYGELFEAEFEIYLTGLVADAYLYITNHGYTPEDKIRVSEKNDAVLRTRAQGSVVEFNEVAEKYGFDYNDFQNANALIYKASRARELLPGTLGEEQYETMLENAKGDVRFYRYYDDVDFLAVPMVKEYYVE